MGLKDDALGWLTARARMAVHTGKCKNKRKASNRKNINNISKGRKKQLARQCDDEADDPPSDKTTVDQHGGTQNSIQSEQVSSDDETKDAHQHKRQKTEAKRLQAAKNMRKTSNMFDAL